MVLARSEDPWPDEIPTGEGSSPPRVVVVINTAMFTDRVVAVTSSRLYRAGLKGDMAEELARAVMEEPDPDLFLTVMGTGTDFESIREVKSVVGRNFLTIENRRPSKKKPAVEDVVVTCDDSDRRDAVFHALEASLGPEFERRDGSQSRVGMVIGASFAILGVLLTGGLLHAIASRIASGGHFRTRSGLGKVLKSIAELIDTGGALVLTGVGIVALLVWLVVRLRRPLEYRRLVRVEPGKR